MKLEREKIRLSATDLSNHLACHHLTSLNLAVARRQKEPPRWKSPDLWVLQQRGLEHERAYLQHLKNLGLSIVDLSGVESEQRSFDEACAAMKAGADVIAQATLMSGQWLGRTDVLRRVEKPSNFGKWSYETYDCKLANETRAGSVLQLSLYSDLLAEIQGILPDLMYVVPPAAEYAPEAYRVLDFDAYYRQVKAKLEEAVKPDLHNGATYPDPNPHCSICRWWQECKQCWRKDDHLSLVAGIRKLQRKQLSTWGVNTVQSLARLPLPLQRRPEHGSIAGYVRVREQARVQVAGRDQRAPVFELLERLPERGLARLPEPSKEDIFFDLEGDPFVPNGGLEYLFGLVSLDSAGQPRYECRWAFNRADERAAFEWLVDFLVSAWTRDPTVHFYHFTPYEPSALKRLMGRYASREDAVDRILRASRMVDLHSIVRQGVRASVEEYSLKTLEEFHGFKREMPLEESRHAMRLIEHSLELATPLDLEESTRSTIEAYNRDDCVSALSLRNWLEQRRSSLIQAGEIVLRPKVQEGAPSESLDERQQRVLALCSQLNSGVPVEIEARSEEQQGRWLLAALLDWHRREDKAEWWEFFRLRELSDEELLDEKSALSGLEYVGRVGFDRKLPIDRYHFARQDTDIRVEDVLLHRGEKVGTAFNLDLATRNLDIKKMKKTADTHPTSVFTFLTVNSQELADSLYRLGSWVQAHGIDAPGTYRAARDLLLRRSPRVVGALPYAPLVRKDEGTLGAAKRIGVSLDSSILPVQGPPGAGKTYTGARMICEALRRGQKVGITAASHKVIRNLLEEVVKAGGEQKLSGLCCVQKVSEKSDPAPASIKEVTDNASALEALQGAGGRVLAGTAWLWSREEFFESVDTLFIDEAGQMSLANVLAVGQAARNVVLLGDPQQLEQPLRSTHPDGAEASALEHLLAGAKTIAPDRGLFLEETWRLHPSICRFTSELFYDSRLKSRAGLEKQSIIGHPWLDRHGLWLLPVNHQGNQSASQEEVDRVAEVVQSLLSPGVSWIDHNGNIRPLQLDDILIVAPYNAQVSDLSGRLRGARVGTVDKFQGQQAPVVIYSLTTSSPEEAPRGMEFLYNLNRLNVATSRARAACILIASPHLFEPECRTPHQMRLANGLCRYSEMAQILENA